MNILFFPAYFFPEHAASDHIRNNRIQAFAKEGIKTFTYTPVPSRGVSEEVRSLYKKEKKHEILNDGFLIIHRFSMFR